MLSSNGNRNGDTRPNHAVWSTATLPLSAHHAPGGAVRAAMRRSRPREFKTTSINFSLETRRAASSDAGPGYGASLDLTSRLAATTDRGNPPSGYESDEFPSLEDQARYLRRKEGKEKPQQHRSDSGVTLERFQWPRSFAGSVVASW